MDQRAPKGRDPFGRPAFTFLVLALPALCLGCLIFRYGVDTPWGDQWDGMAHLFEKMQAGNLRLADFFAFHNEHRIFFPRLLSFALARLTHWNIRAEMLVIWVLLCVCSVNIWQLARATDWRDSRNAPWLLLASNILLFTPLQWENLLWGFQIGFLLPLATTTAAFWVATSGRRPLDFLGTMVLCLITTFSIASGFTSWFLTAPLLFFTQARVRSARDRIWWSVWLSVALASIFVYFHGFRQPAAHPSEWYAIQHPLGTIRFLLAYLGNPFYSRTALTPVAVVQGIGLTLLISLAVCVRYFWHWRKDRTLIAQAAPWFSLAGITLANGLLTMIGRVGFGISGATPSRYVSFAVMLPIGLIFLGMIVLRHWQAHSSPNPKLVTVRVGAAVYASALSIFLLVASIQCVTYWTGFQHIRLTGKSVLLLSRVLDEPASLKRYVHWAGPALRPRIDVLDQLGYLHPSSVRSPLIREIAASTQGEIFGELTALGRPAAGELIASGWAILPARHRPADSVLLAYENAEGEWIIFARASGAI